MKNSTTNNHSKTSVVAAVKKIIADKTEWIDCVRENKPLSSLKEKGIILSKLG